MRNQVIENTDFYSEIDLYYLTIEQVKSTVSSFVQYVYAIKTT